MPTTFALPPSIASDIVWLEPEEFPAWRRRLEEERRARTLTPARRDALKALLSFHGPDGLFPSDATVAKAAGVSVSTVQRARRDAKALGLLDWKHTRKLVGGRWVQGSNQYEVKVPARPVSPDSQPDRQSQERKIRERLTREPPSAGSDEWGRQNAARMIALLLAQPSVT